MPVDHRRINGPENTVPYMLYTKLNTKSYQEKVREAVHCAQRTDGREHLEHRKMFLKTGVVSQAKGSAYIEVGKTKVIVSCYDPREIPNKTDYSQKGALYCEFKYATFSCPQRRNFQQDADEKQTSIVMKQALEPAVCLHEFPNFQVDIYALVLENDGSALSAAITGAGLALAHAGVPMYDIVSSITLGMIDDKFIIDPNLNEEQLCAVSDVNAVESDGKDHGLIVMSVLHTQEQISQFYQTGMHRMESITKAIDLLFSVNKDVVPLIQKCISNFVLKATTANQDKSS